LAKRVLPTPGQRGRQCSQRRSRKSQAIRLEKGWACRREQGGAIARPQREGIGQQANSLQARSWVQAALQFTDGVAAQPGAFGQGFLGQRRRAAQLA
jgi:hypothetical protein